MEDRVPHHHQDHLTKTLPLRNQGSARIRYELPTNAKSRLRLNESRRGNHLNNNKVDRANALRSLSGLRTRESVRETLVCRLHHEGPKHRGPTVHLLQVLPSNSSNKRDSQHLVRIARHPHSHPKMRFIETEPHRAQFAHVQDHVLIVHHLQRLHHSLKFHIYHPRRHLDEGSGAKDPEARLLHLRPIQRVSGLALDRREYLRLLHLRHDDQRRIIGQIERLRPSHHRLHQKYDNDRAVIHERKENRLNRRLLRDSGQARFPLQTLYPRLDVVLARPWRYLPLRNSRLKYPMFVNVHHFRLLWGKERRRIRMHVSHSMTQQIRRRWIGC